MPKVKTAISIDGDLFEETDTLAQELELPRSQVIALALEDYIRRYRNKKLLAQINAAYADAPDIEDAGTLDIIRSHHRKPGEHEEWK